VITEERKMSNFGCDSQVKFVSNYYTNPVSVIARVPLKRLRRDLGQVLHSQLPVALRREIPAQYPCCIVSATEW